MEIDKFRPSTNIDDRRWQEWNQPDTGWADALIAMGLASAGAFLRDAAIVVKEGMAWEHFPRPSQAAAYRVAGKFILRMVPWISAAELVVVLWELNHRRNDAIKANSKSGIGPAQRGYVPPGYTMTWENPNPPAAGLTVGDPNDGRMFRWDSTVYPVPVDGYSYATMQPLYLPPRAEDQFLRVKSVFDYPYPGGFAWHWRRWVYDGVGPGSLKVGFIQINEWDPPQEMWRVHPDVVPTVMPDVSNPAERQRAPRQVPLRDRWKFPYWKREFGDLIYRESVSPPATRPDTDEGVAPDAPSPNPIPQRPPRPFVPPRGQDDDVVFVPVEGSPETQVGYQRNSHTYQPAPVRTREVKLRANTRTLAYRILNVMTETHDFISAVHKALPKRCRRSRSWKDKDGKWRRALASSMMRDIYNCAGDLNIQKAIIYVVANGLQDLAVGRLNRALNERSGLLGGTTGIQGYGTRVGKGLGESDWHWSQLITDAGDWVASNTSGWSANDIRRGLSR